MRKVFKLHNTPTHDQWIFWYAIFLTFFFVHFTDLTKTYRLFTVKAKVDWNAKSKSFSFPSFPILTFFFWMCWLKCENQDFPSNFPPLVRILLFHRRYWWWWTWMKNSLKSAIRISNFNVSPLSFHVHKQRSWVAWMTTLSRLVGVKCEIENFHSRCLVSW